jgi:hypothetical protein
VFNLKKLLKKQTSDVEIHKIIDKKIIENPDGLKSYMLLTYEKVFAEASEINCCLEDLEFLKLNTRLCKVYFLKVRDYEKYNALKDLHLNLQENEMYNELKDLFNLFKTTTKKKVSISDELIGEIEFFTN